MPHGQIGVDAKCLCGWEKLCNSRKEGSCLYMEHIIEMGTTWRHQDILGNIHQNIVTSFSNAYRKKDIVALQEQLALCYYGSGRELELLELVDVTQANFHAESIDLLNVIYPDYMLFKDNKYVVNNNKTRFAGQPDLVIEVWSDSNTDRDKIFKQTIYASSPITEHWYIEQDSNIVKCMLGKEVLKDQSLKNTLVTQGGIAIDLRHLAL